MQSMLVADKTRISILLFVLIYGAILLLASSAEALAPILSEQGWDWNPVAWLMLAPIAALQNHLHILAHEGAHYHLHRDRRWNDFLANMFCSLPFLGLIRPYRHFHFLHHRHLLDSLKDPEISFYAEQGYYFRKMSRSGWTKLLCLDFCGYHYAQFFVSYNIYLWREWRSSRMTGLHRSELLALIIVFLFCSLAASYWGLDKLLFYWFLPQPTLLFLLLKIQGYGEHKARGNSIAGSTNSYQPNWWIRFFVYPLNSNLHREHHLAAHKPWYQLKRQPNFG